MDIKPSVEALAHSLQLSNLIRTEVEKSGNCLPFSTYMGMALYSPGLGYYSAGAHKIGFAGDFITAPELSPWFGATLAQTMRPVLDHFKSQQSATQILEFGAGSGALAESLLKQLLLDGVILDRYFIMEVSPDLRQRQQERLENFQKNTALQTQIVWIDELPQDFKGVVVANEVIDAMPVDLVVKREDGWHQLGVSCHSEGSDTSEVTQGGWGLTDGPLLNSNVLPSALIELSDSLPVGYQTEIHSQAQAWITSLAKVLHSGLFLTLDYGFPAREYYHPQRSAGTLMAHYRHHAIPDPFHLPGLSDITAHVEWTSLTQTAAQNSMELLGYQSQASYLLNAGIGDLLLANLDPRDPVSYLPHANAVQKLLSEAEMGELFKAIAFGRNTSHDEVLDQILHNLPGFRGRLRQP